MIRRGGTHDLRPWERRLLIILGVLVIAVTALAQRAFDSPVGQEQFIPLGYVAGAGWLLGAFVLRSRRIAALLHVTCSALLILAALPLLLMLRFTLDPTLGDHFALENVQITDPVLGRRVKPGAWGHDAFGFRNDARPAQAPIVAIGDSQTWGMNAPRDATWPAVLSERTGETVYNMGMSAFGPVQYRVLAEAALATLDPHTLIIGLYLGNDLYDAYAAVYGNEAFASLRDPDAGPELFEDTIALRAREATLTHADARYDDRRIGTHFTTGYRTLALNTVDARIAEGLRLTLDQFDAIQQQTSATQVRLIVLLIPTKESVYAALPGETLPPEVVQLAALEAGVRDTIQAHLQARGIETVDPLPDLVAALAIGERLYPASTDGHPLPAGYAILGKAVGRVMGSTGD